MNSRSVKPGCHLRGVNRRRPAFTLIEILIVVAILGIVGAIVLPKFSDASHTARANTLKDDLRYLRTQIVVFKAQHRDTAPGHPGGDASQAATAGDFLDQMTTATDEFSRTGAPSPVYHFGPYLTRMPFNPLNNLDTILMVPDGGAMPPAGMPGQLNRLDLQGPDAGDHPQHYRNGWRRCALHRLLIELLRRAGPPSRSSRASSPPPSSPSRSSASWPPWPPPTAMPRSPTK